MHMTRKQKFIAWLDAIVILGFALYYLSAKNYEFILYMLVVAAVFILVLFTLKRTQFDNTILWGLSIWAWLHMAGGGVKIGGDVLYALHLIPIAGTGDSFILKYDQVVHFFGFGVATLIAYHVWSLYLDVNANKKVVYPLVILTGMGIGSLNEIIEFMTVLLSPETGVGGYYNTMIDMVFNTLGAIAAIIFIHYRMKRVAK